MPRNYLLYLPIVLIVIFLSFIGYKFYSKDKLVYTGAISYFEIEPGIKSFKESPKLNLVSFFVYQLEPDGSITKRESAGSNEEDNLIKYTHSQKKKILLGLLNYGDAKRVEDLFSNKEKQSKNIEALVKLTSNKNYDGIILDYEGLSENSSDSFTSYVSDLTNAAHAQGKSVRVSTIVSSKGKLFGGINVLDVSRIVDGLELQVYGQNGQDETSTPGPVAGADWIDGIIKNTIEQGVNPNKIVLGVTDSAHDFIDEPNPTLFSVTTSREALIYLKKARAKFTWDNTAKEYIATYTDNEGKNHKVWLEESKSFQAKQQLARKYKLQGIFIWYLGAEDPNLWK